MTAFDDGISAKKSDQSKDSNPHDPASSEWIAWDMGWLHQDEKESEVAGARLGSLFSKCPKNETGHSWDLDSRKCRDCGQEYPYSELKQ